MLPTKFGVNWPFSSGEVKNRFSRWQPWRPSWISNQNDFSYFDLLVTLTLPIKFQDNLPFVSEEAKNRFSRWLPSWTSDRNDLVYKTPCCFIPSFKSVGLSVLEIDCVGV